MIKRKFLLFLVITLCLYFVFSGIFGNNGYLHNKYLKQQLSVLEEEARKLGVDINSLIDDKNKLNTEEGIRDAAVSLGYYISGDTIHVFDGASLQSSDNKESKQTETEVYKPMSAILCLIIAAALSCGISILSYVVSKKKAEKHDIIKNQPTDHPDNYFINA